MRGVDSGSRPSPVDTLEADGLVSNLSYTGLRRAKTKPDSAAKMESFFDFCCVYYAHGKHFLGLREISRSPKSLFLFNTRWLAEENREENNT